MFYKGDHLIVADSSLQDRYHAIAAEECPEDGRSVLVTIQRMLRYPIQHAILWPDTPNNVKPLDHLCTCRMKVIRRARHEEIFDLKSSSYDASRKRCLEEALSRAKTLDSVDLPILFKHQRGEDIPRSRVVLSK